MLSGGDAVWRSLEIKPVGNTGVDIIILPDPEQVLSAILISKHNIMAVPEKPQSDIWAGALQHKVGLSFDLKTKQYGFYGKTGE